MFNYLTDNYNFAYKNTLIADEKRAIIRTNLLLIRETFNLIKDSRISNPQFYDYIIPNYRSDNSNRERSAAEKYFDQLIQTGYGKTQFYSSVLISHGISPLVFGDAFFDADEQLLLVFYNYFLMNGNNQKFSDINTCRNVLRNFVFTIKNPENDILLIDCIRALILDYLKVNPQDDAQSYDIAEQLIDLSTNLWFTQKQYKNMYKALSQKLDAHSIPSLPEKTVASKKIYGLNKDVINQNLFYIREAFLLFAELNMIDNAEDKFYKLLSINKADYANAIMKDNIISNIQLAEIFAPYKFPVTLFRNDNPTLIDLENTIYQAYENFEQDNDIQIFRNTLKLELCYKISTKNMPFIISICSIIKAVESTD